MEIMRLSAKTRDTFLAKLKERSTESFAEEERAVAGIIQDVRQRGDEALFDYARRFDGFALNADNIRVTKDEIREAYSLLDDALLATMKKSAQNIRAFHERQLRQSWMVTEENGSILGQRILPMDISGVYVPGGTASYPSSVLMNVIPAKVAGVKRIIMTTPASGADDGTARVGGVSAYTLVAADIAGADEIYKTGGAQAIAAMAFGTASVPKTDKITGPGNIYVALAKKAVFGHVSIDSVAGPSEILVLADETANPSYVAADLLSQAEHDEKASAILVTTSSALAEAVAAETERMTELLERKQIIRKSLSQYGAIFVADTKEDAIDAVNAIASEHLEILTKDPFADMTKVRHAGAIFLGPYSSEPLGDYLAGPNHILPTNGTARFFSPLSVDDFIRKTSIIACSREALYDVHEDIERFARAEGLTAHAASVALRFADDTDGKEHAG